MFMVNGYCYICHRQWKHKYQNPFIVKPCPFGSKNLWNTSNDIQNHLKKHETWSFIFYKRQTLPERWKSQDLILPPGLVTGYGTTGGRFGWPSQQACSYFRWFILLWIPGEVYSWQGIWNRHRCAASCHVPVEDTCYWFILCQVMSLFKNIDTVLTFVLWHEFGVTHLLQQVSEVSNWTCDLPDVKMWCWSLKHDAHL